MPKNNVRRRTRLTIPTTNEESVASGGRVHDNLRLHISYVAPKDLKPPKSKSRKHSKLQLERIASSVRAHGFMDPLLVNTENQIACGYARWLVACDLNLELVPVIVAEHLSPEQLSLYSMAENRLGELSEWDFAELRAEFIELEKNYPDLNLEDSQFATSEIDDILYGKEPQADGEAEPKPKGAAVTLLGDLWQMGNHRLYCGDSLEPASFEALMQGEKAAMVFADAPYNLSSRTISGMGKHQHADFKQAAGELSVSGFTGFLGTSFQRLCENSHDGSLHFQCMDWRHMREMLAAGYEQYSELKNLIIFAKPSAGMGTCYRSQHELIFLWKHGSAQHINNFGLGETGRHRSNLWTGYKGNAGFHRDREEELAAHPTVKPWSLVADAMRDCSKRGSIILDPFGGYGTTAIAAQRTGRKARLIELDPLYCDASIIRWQHVADQDAILAATGQTFAEVAAARGIDLAGDDDADEGDLDGPGEDETEFFSDDDGEDA